MVRVHLFKAVLDFEQQAVEANDFNGAQGRIGRHQQAASSGRINDHHEAHEPSNGPPKQVADPILEGDIFLAIDGTGSLFHHLSIVEQ